jgi:hypothetical protein
MADLNGFDANQVEPNADFAPLPPDTYEAMIVESEWKTTAAGTGRYLKLTLQVLGGQYSGRMIWDNLNLENPSAQAVQIARGTLSAICRAVGVLTPKDSVDLHNLPLMCRVVQEPYEGGVSNKIKGYKPKATSAPTKAEAPAKAAPASAGKAPWRK